MSPARWQGNAGDLQWPGHQLWKMLNIPVALALNNLRLEHRIIYEDGSLIPTIQRALEQVVHGFSQIFGSGVLGNGELTCL